MVLVLSNLKVVCPSKLGEMSSSVAERGELGTLQGVPCPGGSNSRPPGILPVGVGHWPTSHGRATLGGAPEGRLASSVRRFTLFPLVFGAFLEVPTSYRCDSFAVAKLS